MVESDDGHPPDGLRAELEAGRAAAAQGLRQLADRIEALPLPDSGSASVDSGRAEAVASGSVTHLRTPGAGHAARACVGVPRPRAGYAPLKADAGKAAAPVENGASRRHVENAREGAPHVAVERQHPTQDLAGVQVCAAGADRVAPTVPAHVPLVHNVAQTIERPSASVA